MKFSQTQLSNFIQVLRDNSSSILSLQSSIVENPIDLYKKGSKIKIKEKNKGSFTRYCGGNVTSECIQRGKNSPDPAIRKKATFAANARSWNH